MSAQYKAGELVILENGEYSDRSWSGPFRVLKDFDMVELAEQLKATFQPEQDHYSSEPGPYDFIQWLSAEGYLQDVECRRVHVGSYGQLEVER